MGNEDMEIKLSQIQMLRQSHTTLFIQLLDKSFSFQNILKDLYQI